MTRKEAILAMLDGKEVTNDELIEPDIMYCIYDEKYCNPFRFITNGCSKPIDSLWSTKTWRLRKYQPKHNELVWCWDEEENTFRTLAYFNRTGIYNYSSSTSDIEWDNYAPYTGDIPEGMMKPEDLE